MSKSGIKLSQKCAREAILAYRGVLGYTKRPDLTDESIFTDLVADILHLAHAKGHDPARVIRMAHTHCVAEMRGE